MTAKNIERVLIVGAGRIGKQIAIQCALGGAQVNLFDNNLEVLHAAPSAYRELLSHFAGDDAQLDAWMGDIPSRIRLIADAQTAVEQVDLLIEAVPEQVRLKREVFKKFAAICHDEMIFVTNTSTLLPSSMAQATGRLDRYAAFHFVMERDMVEIMPHADTAPDTIQALQHFGVNIGLFVTTLKTEHPGAVLNNMLMALNGAAIALASQGVAPPEEIDRVFMKALQATPGPFGALDSVGLDTALEITERAALLSNDPQTQKNADFLREYVNRGDLGVKTGRGFYCYPNPSYRQSGFLDNGCYPPT